MTHVLVVDDEEPIRDLLVTFLKGHGFEAAAAENGLKALEMVPTLRPRTILLDITMPGLNGIETLKKLRKVVPASAVIMISGQADQETALKALELGACDYIQKPFDLNYLEQVVAVKIATTLEE